MIHIFADIHENLPKHNSKEYVNRSLALINRVIIHHSGTTSGSPESFARYHVNKRGWAGIGYHYVIDKHGFIFQTQPLSKTSYHTSGKNTSSIGICLIGNFDKEELKEDQKNALIKTLKMLRSMGIDFEIHGHRDFTDHKTCPGNNIDIEEIRIESQ